MNTIILNPAEKRKSLATGSCEVVYWVRGGDMKRFFFLLALCLTLAGCTADAPEVTPKPTDVTAVNDTITPMPVETPAVDRSIAPAYPGVPMDEVEFAAYEAVLSAEDWAALQGFLPALTEQQPVQQAIDPFYDDSTPQTFETMYLHEFFLQWNLSDPVAMFPLTEFALCDITGDGEPDLVLHTAYCAGWYFVLHRENDVFYSVALSPRQFQMLQTSGVYHGSGGAGYSFYERMYFENGEFREEALGRMDYDEDTRRPIYYIAEKEVPEEEFRDWEATLMADAETWYFPISISQ